MDNNVSLLFVQICIYGGKNTTTKMWKQEGFDCTDVHLWKFNNQII